jgi:hypothetical protein
VEVEAIAGVPVEFGSGTIGCGGGAADLDKLAGFGFGKVIEPEHQPPVLGAQREVCLDRGLELASTGCHWNIKKLPEGWLHVLLRKCATAKKAAKYWIIFARWERG